MKVWLEFDVSYHIFRAVQKQKSFWAQAAMEVEGLGVAGGGGGGGGGHGLEVQAGGLARAVWTCCAAAAAVEVTVAATKYWMAVG